MSNTFPSFSINDGDWVRVRQFIQHVSTIELQGGGSLVPYTGAISNVNLGSHTFTTTGTAATGNLTVSSTLVLASGSITDTTGTVDFSDDRIKTLGDFTSPKGTGTIYGNEAFGRNSLLSVTTGDYNTAFGSRALEAVTIGHSNTAVGRKAGVSLTEGDYNIAIGLQALQNATTANQNVAIGKDALVATTTGDSNFACGYNAVNSLTEGTHNVGLGSGALGTITTHHYNVAIGSSALAGITASECVGIGYNAGVSSGTQSISIGAFAGYVIGAASVSIGRAAGYTTTLNNNVFIGHEAGRLNEGSGNIFLGYQAGRAETGSNKLYIQNSDSATPLIYGDFSVSSLTINGTLTSGTHTIGTLVLAAASITNTAGLNLNIGASSDVLVFADSTEGETKELQIYGYRTGDAKRSLQIGVGTDVDDTASFNGVSKYYFGGWVGVGRNDPKVAMHVYDEGQYTSRMIFETNNVAYYPGIQLQFDHSGTRRTLMRASATGTTGTELQFWTVTDGGSIAQRLTIDDGGNVGIGTATPDTKLQVVGGCKFGDDNTSYASFANDGEVTLTGTARVNKHVRVSAAAIALGANAPTRGYVGIFPTLDFDALHDDDCHYSLIVPFAKANGTTVKVVVDWCYTGADDTGTVRWELEHICVASGEAVAGGTTTISKTTAGNHTSGNLIRTILDTGIVGCVAHDILGLHLTRVASVDTMAADAHLIQVHFEYIMDKLGEPT